MNKVVSNKKSCNSRQLSPIKLKMRKKAKIKSILKAIKGTLLCKLTAAIFKLCVVELRTNTS